MKNKDLEAYENWKNNNLDYYGKGIFCYAERWANLMEQGIESGEQLENIAEETSKEADTDGITGFMYGAAVSVLSKCWEHGERFKAWHNNKYGYRGSGVVNPAIINISAKEK